jgi:hypothetical protein
MAGGVFRADASGEGPDAFSRLMLIAAVVAAAGAVVVALYTLLPGCGGRPTDGLILGCIVITVVAAAVALLGSPFAWLASRRSGGNTATARLALALAVLDGAAVLGVGVLILRATIQCGFGGPGSSI